MQLIACPACSHVGWHPIRCIDNRRRFTSLMDVPSGPRAEKVVAREAAKALVLEPRPAAHE